jgi:hypothetical protein
MEWRLSDSKMNPVLMSIQPPDCASLIFPAIMTTEVSDFPSRIAKFE